MDVPLIFWWHFSPAHFGKYVLAAVRDSEASGVEGGFFFLKKKRKIPRAKPVQKDSF